MKNNDPKKWGITLAILAAVSYGMNPFFALPLYQSGFSVDSVLTMRFLFAAPFLGILALTQGVSLKIKGKELLGAIAAGILFALCSMFLYMSYQKMDVGIASTLLFAYPLLVAPIMWICFHEKPNWSIVCGIIVSFIGVLFLCRNSGGEWLNWVGIVLVVLSALTYAIYLVVVGHTFLRNIPAPKLTFYAVLTSGLFFLIRTHFGLNFPGTFTPATWGYAIGAALVATVISIGATNLALQKIGASKTAVLGALEPLTAVVIGVMVFHEAMTLRIVVGILLILSSVTFVVLCKNKE